MAADSGQADGGVMADVTEHGTKRHYHGVVARDVLALVGAPFDKQMRGSALALVVKVHAADGYVVAFALAEFDAAHREQAILLADQHGRRPAASMNARAVGGWCVRATSVPREVSAK